MSENKRGKDWTGHCERKAMKIVVAQRGGRWVCDANYSNANEAGRQSPKGDARDGDQFAVIIGIASRPLGAAQICRHHVLSY